MADEKTCKHCKAHGGFRPVALFTDTTKLISVAMVKCSHTSHKEWERIKPRRSDMGRLASDPVPLPKQTSKKKRPTWLTVVGEVDQTPEFIKKMEENNDRV